MRNMIAADCSQEILTYAFEREVLKPSSQFSDPLSSPRLNHEAPQTRKQMIQIKVRLQGLVEDLVGLPHFSSRGISTRVVTHRAVSLGVNALFIAETRAMSETSEPPAYP